MSKWEKAENKRLERMKQKKDKTIVLTSKQLDLIVVENVQALKKEIYTHIEKSFLNLIKLVLHDTFGFGKVRILRLEDELRKTLDCIEQKYVSVEDIEKWHNNYMGC